MRDGITHVGLDAHQETIVVAVLLAAPRRAGTSGWDLTSRQGSVDPNSVRPSRRCSARHQSCSWGASRAAAVAKGQGSAPLSHDLRHSSECRRRSTEGPLGEPQPEVLLSCRSKVAPRAPRTVACRRGIGFAEAACRSARSPHPRSSAGRGQSAWRARIQGRISRPDHRDLAGLRVARQR